MHPQMLRLEYQHQSLPGGPQEQPWRLGSAQNGVNMGTYLEHFTDFVAFLIVGMVLVFAIVSELVLTRPSREDLSGYVIVFSIISGCVLRCFA